MTVVAAPVPAAVGSLKARVWRAALWTLGGDYAAYALRFGSNLVLTRLVLPEAFGLMVLVNTFLVGLQLFSDFGLRPNVIQSRRGDDPAFLDTAWTLQIMRGVVLWIFSCLAAWPLARFYGHGLIGVVLPVAGLQALVSGFNSTRLYTNARHLSLRQVTLLGLGSTALGAAVMIAWAWISPSVWALVAGGVISAGARAFFSHVALPGRPNGLRWEPEARRELFRFGKWIFAGTLTSFLAMQSDRLIFAKLIPLGLLGVYGIASMLSRLPAETLGNLGQSVILPAYSRALERDGSLVPVYKKVRARFLVLGGACMAALIMGGPTLVNVLYPTAYEDAGWILRFLAVATWFTVMESSNGDALIALGTPAWIAACNVAKIASMVALVPLGFMFYGFHGALGGFVLAEIPKYLVVTIGARRAGLPGWGVELALTALLAFSAFLAVATERLLPDPGHFWARVGLLVLGAGLLWGPAAAWALRSRKGSAA
jgi:O-antigen/teichoic acid export membrane protein